MVDGSTVITIKFFYRYLKKTNRFGFIDIKIVDWVPKVEPARSMFRILHFAHIQ
jgi:hypothetical protein